MQFEKFKNKYRIESTRLKYWDYKKEGGYFITICTKDREHIFGAIKNGKMQYSPQGEICFRCWQELPLHYNNCFLDEFIIMPNHVQGILILQNHNLSHHFIGYGNVETGLKPVSTEMETIEILTKNMSKPFKYHSISEIIRGFKTFSARKINILQNTSGKPVWQTRFYDHIIRNEKTLRNIRRYIVENPEHWQKDSLYE